MNYSNSNKIWPAVGTLAGMVFFASLYSGRPSSTAAVDAIITATGLVSLGWLIKDLTEMTPTFLNNFSYRQLTVSQTLIAPTIAPTSNPNTDQTPTSTVAPTPITHPSNDPTITPKVESTFNRKKLVELINKTKECVSLFFHDEKNQKLIANILLTTTVICVICLVANPVTSPFAAALGISIIATKILISVVSSGVLFDLLATDYFDDKIKKFELKNEKSIEKSFNTNDDEDFTDSSIYNSLFSVSDSSSFDQSIIDDDEDFTDTSIDDSLFSISDSSSFDQSIIDDDDEFIEYMHNQLTPYEKTASSYENSGLYMPSSRTMGIIRDLQGVAFLVNIICRKCLFVPRFAATLFVKTIFYRQLNIVNTYKSLRNVDKLTIASYKACFGLTNPGDANSPKLGFNGSSFIKAMLGYEFDFKKT